MKVTYADGVFEELVALSFYIAEENEDAAHKFLDACDETFNFLAGHKFIGTVRNFQNPGLSDIRMWRVKNFEKYLIFYKPCENGVTILHILHSATDYNRLFEDLED